MANSYVFDLAALKVKAEVQNGEFIEPDILVPGSKGVGVLNPDVNKIEVDPMSNHLGSKYTVINGNFLELPIEIDMPLPTNVSLVETLFLGCGVVGSAIDGGKEFKFNTNNKTTLSFKQIAERETTTARGARGNFELSVESGGEAKIKFSFKSLFNDKVKLNANSANNSVPDSPVCEMVFMTDNCNGYLVNGNSVHFSKVTLKLGADVKVAKDTCSLGAYTQDIKPELEVELFDSVDNEQSFNDLKNGVEFNFVIPLYDANGTKKWEIIVPKCVAIEHDNPVEDGRIKINRTLECRKVNGDDNFIIKYYN